MFNPDKLTTYTIKSQWNPMHLARYRKKIGIISLLFHFLVKINMHDLEIQVNCSEKFHKISCDCKAHIFISNQYQVIQNLQQF